MVPETSKRLPADIELHRLDRGRAQDAPVRIFSLHIEVSIKIFFVRKGFNVSSNTQNFYGDVLAFRVYLCHPQAGDGVCLVEVLSLDVLVDRLRQRHVHRCQRHPFQAGHPGSPVAGDLSADELSRDKRLCLSSAYTVVE